MEKGIGEVVVGEGREGGGLVEVMVGEGREGRWWLGRGGRGGGGWGGTGENDYSAVVTESWQTFVNVVTLCGVYMDRYALY